MYDSHLQASAWNIRTRASRGVWRARYARDAILLDEERTLRRQILFATTIYVGLLFWALWLKFDNVNSVVKTYHRLHHLNIKERFLYGVVPFRRDGVGVRMNQRDLILNAIAFSPFGILMNHYFENRNFRRDLSLCFLMSLCIEMTQLATRIGSFSSDDLIANTMGYFIGFVFYKLFLENMSVRSTIRFYRITNVIYLPLLAYALYVTLKNREVIIAILTRRL